MIPVARAAKRAHNGHPQFCIGGNYEVMPGQLPGRVPPPPDFWPEQLRRLGGRPFRNEMPALRELLGEPTWRVPVVDWGAVHAGLGFQLPADYREFINTYGPGTFLDIRIAGPGAPGEMGLFGFLERKYAPVGRIVRAGTPPFYPEPGGAVCRGETQDGQICAWAPVAEDPDEWPVTAILSTRDLKVFSLRPGASFSEMLREHAQPNDSVHPILPSHNIPGPVSFTPRKWV